MDNELKIVLSNTYTIDDAYRRLSLARQFIEQIFFTSDEHILNWRADLEKFLEAKGGEPATRAALAAWGEEWFKKFKPDNINEKFIWLESAIDQVPGLTIVVPVVLPAAEISRLGQWARANVASEVMVSIRVDPQAVGGCMIIWQGLHIDMSLHYFFTKNRDALTELVHSEK